MEESKPLKKVSIVIPLKNETSNQSTPLQSPLHHNHFLLNTQSTVSKISEVPPKYSHYMKKNFEILKEKLFSNTEKNQDELDEQLKQRSKERKEKWHSKDKLLNRYMDIEKKSKEVKGKISQIFVDFKIERDTLMELAMKMKENTSYEGLSQKEYKFHLHNKEITRPNKKSSILIPIPNSKQEDLIRSRNMTNITIENGVEKSQEQENENDKSELNDDDINMDDKSIADMASVFSRTRSQAEREWEYSSQKEYSISEIQKLTEMPENEVVASLNQEKPEENLQVKENEEAVKMKNAIAQKKKKLGNTKIEKPEEEFLLFNINQKIDYVLSFDFIEKTSLCLDLSSNTHPDYMVQYYREISSAAREVVSTDPCFRGQFYEQTQMDILEGQDTYIDERRITFSDVINIVSERIPDDKIFNFEDTQSAMEYLNTLNRQDHARVEPGQKVMYSTMLKIMKFYNAEQIKRFYQITKEWADKQFQSSYKQIVEETKTVTDWLMEDLFHIRKATISSQGLDFHPKFNKAVQNQLYHKFEEKLLILLQMILYREQVINPIQQAIKQKLPSSTLKQMRIQYEEDRRKEEEKFSKLYASEDQLIKDLKALLQDLNKIENKWIDGRSKSEMLRIFLVDYIEIVKYKKDKLSKIKEIESEISEIDGQTGEIKSKSPFQRLFEQKIGHVKGKEQSEEDENKQQNDQKFIEQLTEKKSSLLKERDSILLTSAQILKIPQPLKKQEKKKIEEPLLLESETDQNQKEQYESISKKADLGKPQEIKPKKPELKSKTPEFKPNVHQEKIKTAQLKRSNDFRSKTPEPKIQNIKQSTPSKFIPNKAESSLNVVNNINYPFVTPKKERNESSSIQKMKKAISANKSYQDKDNFYKIVINSKKKGINRSGSSLTTRSIGSIKENIGFPEPNRVNQFDQSNFKRSLTPNNLFKYSEPSPTKSINFNESANRNQYQQGSFKSQTSPFQPTSKPLQNSSSSYYQVSKQQQSKPPRSLTPTKQMAN